MTEIIDISLEISEDTLIYPGNPEVDIEEIDTSGSKISRIDFGSHTGTHVDGPQHVFDDGKGVNEAFRITQFVGDCEVLDMTHREESVKKEDFEGIDLKEKSRIIVKTKNSKEGFERFRDDFVYLDGKAAEFISGFDLELFGIDYLSVKQRASSDNRPHKELLKNNIVIFEGLDLSGVEPGGYTFVGLPLKIKDIDGAPARALLIEDY
ncbi:MAG: cyclase family protein [Candidatus Magasanikbacteria bacterium]